jgi:hypothetical protein
MNFWTFTEDHSRGYYHAVSNKAARKHGAQLVYSLFFFVTSLLRIVWNIAAGIASLLVMIFYWLLKLKR